jgi:hypothetical protein
MRRKLLMLVLFTLVFGLGYLTAQQTQERHHVPVMLIEPEAVNVILGSSTEPMEVNINHNPSESSKNIVSKTRKDIGESAYGDPFDRILAKYHSFRGSVHVVTDKWGSCGTSKLAITYETLKDSKKDRIIIAEIPETKK